jgi:hypothetical protein
LVPRTVRWYARLHLLRTLGATQPERQAVIRGYIEPSEEERAKGLKVPIEAHHAIARLAAGSQYLGQGRSGRVSVVAVEDGVGTVDHGGILSMAGTGARTSRRWMASYSDS